MTCKGMTGEGTPNPNIMYYDGRLQKGKAKTTCTVKSTHYCEV